MARVRMSISIITVAKNSASTIADTMTSVVRQDYPCEYVLVDGCSTDNTLEIMRELAPPTAKIISEPDKNLFEAMNKGLSLATGDIAAFLNADDYYASSRILSRVAEQFKDDQIDSCYGDLIYVDLHDPSRVTRRWRAGPYDRSKFYNGWMPPHPTFFARRTIYERYGAFNTDIGSSADYEIMLRFLFKHGVSASYIPEVMVVMRTGGLSGSSFRNRWLANRNDRLAWKINGLKPKPWSIIAKPLSKLGQFLTFGTREKFRP
jgi:glycosyltransferase involved in cell wall biosynthesis